MDERLSRLDLRTEVRNDAGILTLLLHSIKMEVMEAQQLNSGQNPENSLSVLLCISGVDPIAG